MFGLLQSISFDLPVGATHAWSSVVCSTCVHLGEKSGMLARFAAGPDTALLAALYQSQSEASAPAFLHHCPFRARATRLWRKNHLGTRFAATVSLLAAAARLQDHLLDGDPLPVPRWLARRLARQWAAAAQETADRLGFDTRPLQQRIDTQRQREAQPGQPFAHYAEPTAFCFGEAFAHTAQLSRRPENSEPLRQAGVAFGQQVYLLDAAADFAADLRHWRFNPLQAHGATTATAGQTARRLAADAQQTLELHLARVVMPQPAWVWPILVDGLRQIGQQRLACGPTCVSAEPPSPAAQPEEPAESPAPSRRKHRVTLKAVMLGAGSGLTCGGCCGFCFGCCQKKCDDACRCHCDCGNQRCN